MSRRRFANSLSEDQAGDGLWNTYLDAVEDEDKASVESWNGSTAGILTFTGLFAATVAAFVIESYKMLQPDTSKQVIALLAQIVLATNTTPVVPISLSPSELSRTPSTAVIVNVLWFTSLVIALICALLATLVQEWTRDFLRDTRRRSPDTTLKEYAFNHIYVRMGVERYRLDDVTTLIVTLMHVAVVIFLVGLGFFLFDIDHTTAWVIAGVTGFLALLYVLLSIIPFWDHSCPYRTPMTYVFVLLEWFVATIGVMIALPTWIVMTSLAERDWSWLSDISKFRPAQVTVGLRGIFHGLTPTRSLPGHEDLPVDIPDYFSPDKISAQRCFVDHARMTFIWRHTSEYLLNGDGKAVLLHYLPFQLLDHDSHDFGFFFVYLRHRERFMQSFARMMLSVDSVVDAVGVLRLLQMLFVAEDDTLEDSALGVWDGRWEAMGSVLIAFPDFIRRLNSMEIALKGLDLELVAALSNFRWALLIVRIKLLRQNLHEDIPVLDRMLIGLEDAKGFRLLSLYSDDDHEPGVELALRFEDVTFCYELAARNALTMLAHLLGQNNSNAEGTSYQAPDSPYPKRGIPNMWHWDEVFRADEIAASVQEASKRLASPILHTILRRLTEFDTEECPPRLNPFKGNRDLANALHHLAGVVSALQPQQPEWHMWQGEEQLREFGVDLQRPQRKEALATPSRPDQPTFVQAKHSPRVTPTDTLLVVAGSDQCNMDQ